MEPTNIDEYIILAKNLFKKVLTESELETLKEKSATNNTHVTLNRIDSMEYGFFVRLDYDTSCVKGHIVSEVPLDYYGQPCTYYNGSKCLYLYIPGKNTYAQSSHSTLNFRTNETNIFSKNIASGYNPYWCFIDDKPDKKIDIQKTIERSYISSHENDRVFLMKLTTSHNTSITTGNIFSLTPSAEVSYWLGTNHKMDFSLLDNGQLGFTYINTGTHTSPIYHESISNNAPTYYLAIPETELIVEGEANIMSLNININKISETKPYIICCGLDASKVEKKHRPITDEIGSSYYYNKYREYNR